MTNKYLPIPDEGAGPGPGGVVIEGSPQDNEVLTYNRATGNLQPSGGVTAEGGTLNTLPSSITVGQQKVTAGGENLKVTNTFDNETFYPVWVSESKNIAEARITTDQFLKEFVFEASKVDVLVNPAWIANPLVDWRVETLTFESDTTITNVELTIKKGGDVFFIAQLGTLTANVEKTIDLTSTADDLDNVSVDAFVGPDYNLVVSSPDGDVRLKGSTANALPFFKVGYRGFEDRENTNQGVLPISQDDTDNSVRLGQLGDSLDVFVTGDARIMRDDENQVVTSVQTNVSFVSDVTSHTITYVMPNSPRYIEQIRLSNDNDWRNVRIQVTASGDTLDFRTDLTANPITFITLPRQVLLEPGDTLTVVVTSDAESFGGDPSVPGMRLRGIDGGIFSAYFVFRANLVTPKVLDPDLREQRRTAILGVNRLGYQSAITDGDPTRQGWADISTGAASINVIADPNDGLTTLQFLDDANNGVAAMQRTLDAESFQNLFNFGGQLNFVVQALRHSDDIAIVGGVGFSAANDPGWKGGARGRFMLQISIAVNGNQIVTPEGGTSHEINVKNDYIEVVIEIAAGTMLANVYADGTFLEQVDFSVNGSNSNWDNRYRFSSGGTSSVNREAYLRESLLTEFTSDETIPLFGPQIEANSTVIIPDGVVRDWIVLFPDDDVETFSKIQGNLTAVGTVTFQRQDNSTTFNGEESIRLAGLGSAEVRQVNIDPGAPNRAYQITTSGDTQIVPLAVTQKNPLVAEFTPEPRPRLSSIRNADLSLSSTEKIIALDPMLHRGDLWDDSGNLKFWDGLAWVDPSVFPQSSTYSAQWVFFQTTAPAADADDLDNFWVHPTTQQIKYWDGAAWQLSADQDIQNLLAERTLYTSASEPVNGTTRAVGLSVTPDGTILVKEDGYYTGNLTMYVQESGDVDYAVWIEHKPVATGVWELAGTMTRNRTSIDSTGTASLNGGIDAVEGDEVRVKIKRISGTGALEKRTLSTDLGTVVQYPAALSVWKAARKTP